ncbi:MAG: hypothetical protein EPO68_15815 [Planctomycetota bacterium]|nr:MAG: hypothetical protein EPO68_15815 [Planctomycetota bacterium]
MCVFGVAVGWFEAAVVTYLRVAYYPDGLRFPLAPLPGNLLRVELAREAASIVLLAACARLAGRHFLERFAAFMVLFGIWDLVYYAGLWLTLDWPASLATLDILFLIPTPWVGPVWAPCAVSVALIGGGSWIYLTPEREHRVTALDWVVEIAAGLVIIGAMMTAGHAIEGSAVPLDDAAAREFPVAWFWAGLLLGVGWFVWREARAAGSSARS